MTVADEILTDNLHITPGIASFLRVWILGIVKEAYKLTRSRRRHEECDTVFINFNNCFFIWRIRIGESMEKKKDRVTTGKFHLTSDYVFREIPQNGSSVQGAIKCVPYDFGLFAEAMAANNELIGGPEARLSAGYKFNIEESKILFGLKYTHYSFNRSASNDMNEYTFFASWKKRIYFTVDYADEWRNLSDSNLHYALSGKIKLKKDVKLMLNVGYTDVDNENTFGYDSYLDYGIGLGIYHKNVFYALKWSDTDRELVSAGLKRDAKDKSSRFSASFYF